MSSLSNNERQHGAMPRAERDRLQVASPNVGHEWKQEATSSVKHESGNERKHKETPSAEHECVEAERQ